MSQFKYLRISSNQNVYGFKYNLFSGGTTIHRGLGFNYGTNALSLRDEKLNRLRKEYEDLRVCIIDEISMVGADRLYDINKRFRIIFNNYEAFGGLGAFFIGDLMQLPPPNARKVYLQPMTLQNQALFYSDESLWKNCKSVVLKVNHRQGEGNDWTHCLNRIRTAEKTIARGCCSSRKKTNQILS